MYRIVEAKNRKEFGILVASKGLLRNRHKFYGAAIMGSLLYLVLGFCWALPSVSAQSIPTRAKTDETSQMKGTGIIAGSVQDPQRAVVVGAQVKLTDPSAKRVFNVLTDERGEYRFPSLPITSYNLEVSAKGFKAVLIQGIKATAYVSITQDITLSIGETSEIVNVTADQGYETLAPQTLGAIPESVMAQTIVISRDEIEALHPQSVWDVLQQVPGMEVTYQGRQHLDFSSMRGGSYRIILDGVYLSQTDRLLATIPSEMIESMSIVRDATALSIGPLTSFGSTRGAANQGFIVIKTKRASKTAGGFTGSVGTYDTVKGTLYQGARIGRFDFNIAATYYNTDGKSGWHNASRNGSLLFRTGYSLWGFNADVLYYASRGMREMQYGEVLLPTARKDGSLDYSKVGTLAFSYMSMPYMFSSMVGVNVTKPWSDSQKTTFQYAYNRLDVDTTGNSTVASPQNTREQNYSLRHAISFTNNTLTLGGQFLKYEAPTGQAPTMTGQDEGMLGLYVQDEHRMLGDKLILDGGIRSDKKHYFNSPTTGLPMDEWAKAAYTVSVGALYKLSSVFDVNARYGFSESGLSSDQISANGSTLPAEKRSRYEAGVTANIHPSLKPWLALYLYDTKDEKVSSTGIDPTTGQSVTYYIDPVTGDEISFVTISDVLTRGAEFGISGKVKDSWNYNLSYSYLISDNATKNQDMSHHLVNVRLGYRYKNVFANISMNYAGPKYRSSSPGGVFYLEMANYTKVDANVGYNFKLFDRATKITFYGRNLGNNHYFTRYVTGAYKDIGLQYGMELSYSFF